MAYCEHQYRRRFAKERTEEGNKWDKAADDFIENGLWNYCFKREATVSDPEQSFLCRYVFAKLMGTNTDNIPANKIYIENKGTTYHFDVMNNLNGMSYKYTIGNFAPIPAIKFPYEFKVGTEEKVIDAHLQHIHKWKGERWDKLLKLMKAKWDNYVGTPSFEKYMIDTCQQLYYEDIFTDFFNEKPVLDEVNWAERVSAWNAQIKKNMQIISFDNDSSEALCDKIRFLIEARGRCILSILNNRKTTST